MNDVDEFLEHFGVKGMRWGVRNAASSKKKKTSSDYKEAREITKKVRQNLLTSN